MDKKCRVVRTAPIGSEMDDTMLIFDGNGSVIEWFFVSFYSKEKLMEKLENVFRRLVTLLSQTNKNG